MDDPRKHKIRSELPLAYVLERHELTPVDSSGDKLYYHSPWREDENPSLHVYWGDSPDGTRHQRAGDFADDWSGDVFELISRLAGVEFEEAFGQAIQYWTDYKLSGWEGPELEAPSEKPPLGPERLAELFRDRSPIPYHEHPVWKAAAADRPGLVASRNISQDKLFVRQTDGALVYVVEDTQTGDLRGVSFRDEAGRKWQEKGSSRWLSTPASASEVMLNDAGRYLLVEGETDAYAAHGALGDEYLVFAVPGAGMKPARVGGSQIPQGSHVVLALDPDGAGMAAAEKWFQYYQDRDCTVSLAVVPTGHDLAGLSHSDIRRVVGMAQPLSEPSFGIQEHSTGYQLLRPTGTENPKGWEKDEKFKQITDFVLDPIALLVDDAGRIRGFRGTALGREVEIPIELFANAKQLNRWSLTTLGRGLRMQSDTLLVSLVQHLRDRFRWVPRIVAYPTEGLHDGMYVWQDGWTGAMEASVDPGAFRRPHAVSFPRGDEYRDLVDRHRSGALRSLLGAYESADYRAILSWHAAALVRPLLPRSPVLHVVGLSGSGKTTLLTEVNRVFFSTGEPMSAEALTQFALSSYLESSNTWPVWVDEYRATTSSGRRHALEAAILDVYQATSRTSSRGGSEWNIVDTFERNAPLAISGEMTLTQTAHVERAVNVRLRREAMGQIAPMKSIPSGLVGAMLIEHIIEQGYNEALPDEWTKGMDAMERTDFNQRVLEIGWQLLMDALGGDVDHIPLGFNATGAARSIMDVDGTGRNDRSLHNAMLAIYDGVQNHPVIWEQKGTVYVSPANLVLTASRQGLPLVSDNIEDIKAAMVEYYGADPARRKPPPEFGQNNPIRVMAFPASAIGLQKGTE